MSSPTYDSYQWARPERQSPIAIVLILLQFIGKVLRQGWPILLVLLLGRGGKSDVFTNIALVVGLGSTLLSILAYFKFYFYVKDEELVIEKGILQKIRLNIPFDRIQTINFRQNPIHRMFNVVALEIDTAGSKGKEFSILALERNKAEAIRRFLIAQIPTTTTSTSGKESAPPVEAEKTLLQLTLSDLLKIGIGQNHLRGLGIIAAAVFALAEVADPGEKGFVRAVFSFFKQGKETLDQQTIYLWLIGAALIAFLLITSFAMTILRYYDLRFFQTSKGFKVNAGLLNRRERSAGIQKIQMIRWSTNPLKKLFKMFDLRLLQAASTEVGKKQSFYIPGCYDEQLEAVRQTYMPAEGEVTFEEHRINRRIINKGVLLVGLLPLVPFVLSQYLRTGTFPYGLLVWPVVVVVGSWVYYKKWRYYVSDEGIRIRKGIFATSYTLLKWYKIQGAAIHQTIFQQRNGHADLKIYTASGSLTIPYIELEKAQTLMDVVLFKVASSQKGWM